jgi:chemotaxis protein methyltransferase CheR
MAIAPDDLDHLAALVKAACGIVLPPDKAGAIESRLGPVARREDFVSVDALLQRLRADPDQALVRAVVDALRLSETQFFRDRTPFEQFRREVLPAMAGARTGGQVRVWSAGCSTGQEPYSLAMLGEEAACDGAALNLEITATDVSDRCLEKAQSGLYTQFEVQRGLPVRMLVRHFEKVEENWRVLPKLRQTVRWGRFNLMHDPKPLGRFDVIFCRNVLSQFDEPTRAATLERLGSALADDGLLFLGLNETTHGLTELYRPIPGRRGLYCKNPTHLRRVA